MNIVFCEWANPLSVALALRARYYVMFNRFQFLFQINMNKESQMRAAINQKLIEMGERER